jgi:hypothetical protein
MPVLGDQRAYDVGEARHLLRGQVDDLSSSSASRTGWRASPASSSLSFPDEEEQDGPEGCLSMPGLYFDTERRLNVVAKGTSTHGNPVQVVGTGELSRCLQHETDHLDGVLFIDRMDRQPRKAAMRAIREADWSGASVPRIALSPHPMTNGYH